jgi:uncharacterized membrane protein AbrB (regulator of aidB expression)
LEPIVREKLQKAPWWVWSLIEGVSFGAYVTALNLQQSHSWRFAVGGGLIGGVLFGAVMGPILARQHRKFSALVGTLPVHERRIAVRAVTRGAAPLDRDVREAAARLATYRLNELSRTFAPTVAMLVLLTVFCGLLAFMSPPAPWMWIAAACLAVLTPSYLAWPRYLQRRVKILESDVYQGVAGRGDAREKQT